ncbi:hypothetical protein [Sandaracinus amylolyticus]|uniref:hypothetical protein n=1 Tax=Sandaracinus amylolyticus TaxID=927083 RepID=UPI001F46E2A8|nr:hypothetical protein [Sandaracinus amylolyticus]UJR80990.1 Hypothetical protein I5071_30410 [Sandaracinus amylolyticus]
MDGVNEADERALLEIPWSPGQSPFHIKGVAYRGHVEYCDRIVPGGHSAVLAALGRPDVTKFFSQPFLASTRYDVFPLAMVGIGAARVMGTGFSEFVRERTRWQANEDVKGVYRWLLGFTTPEMIGGRLQRLISQYFDFGDVIVEESTKGYIRTLRRGLPRPLTEWYASVSEPYVEVLLGMAGGKNVRCTSLVPIPEGRAHGVDIVSLPFEARWA